jgi:hypothetical protein
MTTSDSQSREPDPEAPPPEVEATEARQGVITGHIRWVLVISTLLAVLALAGAAWWFSAASPGPHTTTPSAAARSA